MRSCKELAERYAEGALANYGRDGELAPAVIILGADQTTAVSVVPVVSQENHGMPGALHAIGSILGPLFEGHYIVLLSETWISKPDHESELADLERGSLEKRALGGDTTVKTGLMVIVFDLDNLNATHTLVYNVEDRYERDDIEGMSEGEISNAMRDVVKTVHEARRNRPPGPVPVAIAKIAVEMLGDHISALLMPEPVGE
jgi:hypothetical protein